MLRRGSRLVQGHPTCDHALSRSTLGGHTLQNVVHPEIYIVETLAKFRLQSFNSLLNTANLTTNLSKLAVPEILQHWSDIPQSVHGIFQCDNLRHHINLRLGQPLEDKIKARLNSI